MLALMLLVWSQKQPVVQQTTVEIPLKHAKAAELDVWLANSWYFNRGVAWAVNYERNSLTVTGSAKEIEGFRSTVEYQDKASIPLEFVFRSIQLPESIKERLEYSVVREWIGPGNAGLLTNYLQFASLEPGEVFNQVNAVPAEDTKTILCKDSGHIRYASNGVGPGAQLSVFCRVNGDKSISTWFVLDSRQDFGHGPQLVRYRGNRRIRKGTMLVIHQHPDGPDLIVLVGDARRLDSSR